MPRVYILLTRSGTWFSRLIHRLSSADYTHVSIALDGELRHFYSFGRQKTRMFPAGFAREELHAGTFRRFHHMPCALYELQVPPEVYDDIAGRIVQIQHEKDIYHYNCLGVLLCKLNLPYPRSHHYFCSQFVAELLQQSGALDFSKASCLVQPGDFLEQPQLKLRYQGRLDQLSLVG